MADSTLAPTRPPSTDLRTSLLLLIGEEPSHGHELRKRLSRFGRGSVQTGRMYQTLRRMEKDGLVASSWETPGLGPARRVYRLAGEPDLRAARPEGDATFAEQVLSLPLEGEPPRPYARKPLVQRHRPGGPMSAPPCRFALADLERVIGKSSGEEVAEALSTTTRTVYRLRTEGMSYAQADRYAVRAGLHPGEVWAEWWALGD